MAFRNYDQVEFSDVPQSYCAGADISLSFRISQQFRASAGDKVGIFKVGWSSANDALHFESVHLPADYKERRLTESTVKFPAEVLPDDDGEFYQFCYMDDTLHACGVSRPFQLRTPNAEDYLETEEADMLIVTSKASAQVEKLARVTAELQELKELNNRLEENRKDLVKMLAQSDEQTRELNARIKDLEADVAEKSDLDKKVDMLQEEISRLRAEESSLRNEVDSKRGDVIQLTNEKEMIQGQLRKVEQQQKLQAVEMANISRGAEALHRETMHQNDRVKQLEEDLKLKEEKCERLLLITNTDKENMERMRERCTLAEDRLAAAESSKSICASEITALQEALDSYRRKLEVSTDENHNLKLEVQRAKDTITKMSTESGLKSDRDAMALKYAEEEKLQLASELMALRAIAERSERRLHDEQSAYRTRVVVLQEELAELTVHAERDAQERQELQNNVAALRSECDDLLLSVNEANLEKSRLQDEIGDLKVRLQQGEREWIKLHQKLEALKRRRTCSCQSSSSLNMDSLTLDVTGGGEAAAAVGVDGNHASTRHRSRDVAGLAPAESFNSAASLASLGQFCPVCNSPFSPDWTSEERTEHVNQHFVESEDKCCPMCNLHFPADSNVSEFEAHVHDHFAS